MKRLINHVRTKPDHIRELIAVVCTVVIVAGVGVIWFFSFKHDVYALLNPDQSPTTDRSFASGTTSLFGSIGQAFSDGKAQIVNFIQNKSAPASPTETITPTVTPSPSQVPHALPVSGPHN